nr:lactonase family protein [Kibdelosporangium sp. MJ126-NF4]CEL17850.1 6-phosphogluconolactonase [Kibdelosporangium sp. MJ126-NF4]CTQ90926.1 6-phosphogluconolactonase (EC 3.1.1.31) [Kibdelosporangium sp. MJ126-NF4]
MSTVYIGSYTSWGNPPGPGFQVGTVDSATGKLTITNTVNGIADPSWFVFSRDRKVLYTTIESDPGKITAFSIADPQRPKVLNSANVNGAAPTHASIHGNYLLAANYTSGSVSVLSLQADGRVGAVTDVVTHTGGSRAAHAHQVVTDPSGRWIVAVDLGTDSVYVYGISSTGKLKLNQQLALPTGLGPRHLTFHPNGRYAYVLGELRSEVTVLAWDSAAGKFTAGQVISTLGGATPPENYPGEIQISPDGRFVYATNRGHESLAQFTVCESGKTLEFVSTTPTGGSWPRHFTFDPSGTRVYVSNQRAGTINWLPRDPATGKLGASVVTAKVGNVGIVSFK